MQVHRATKRGRCDADGPDDVIRFAGEDKDDTGFRLVMSAADGVLEGVVLEDTGELFGLPGRLMAGAVDVA